LKRVGSSDFFQFTIEKGHNDKIEYAIANYCFPTAWPSSKERDEIRKDSRVKLTFGIHPRIVGAETQRTLDVWLRDLEYLLTSKKVVAIGECGLDSSDRPTSREMGKQVKVFKKQLEIAVTKKLTVVVHCRGKPELSDKCLSILTEILPSNHLVDRHCFNGTYQEYCKWKEALPSCKFGISPCVFQESRYPHLRETIVKMKVEDLVLESDAPYLPGKDGERGLQTVIRDIARRIAILHDETTDSVAKVTSKTSKALYCI